MYTTIGYTTLLNKINAPLSGLSLVRIDNPNKISLYSAGGMEQESHNIAMFKDNYTLHVNAGDIVVSNMIYKRTIYNIYDLEELCPTKFYQYMGAGIFQQVYGIPDTHKLVPLDTSMYNIVKNILTSVTGVAHTTGLDHSSKLVLDLNVVKGKSDTFDCKLQYQQYLGLLKGIIMVPEDTGDQVMYHKEIAKGVGIQYDIPSGSKSLIINPTELNFSPKLINLINR